MSHLLRRSCHIKLCFLILLIFYSSVIYCQITPARIFTNGAVFQRDLDIPVWGITYPEKIVVVTINDVSDSSYSESDGKFAVYLPPMSAGGPYNMMITSSGDTLLYSDIYIGDVWLAAGQSNMAWTVNASTGGEADVAAANNQTIREFTVKNTSGFEPISDVLEGSLWYPATTDHVGGFSAVGFYFAMNLQKDINVPIGIINASRGGARIEAFMSQEMLGFDEKFVMLANGQIERQPTTVFNTLINPITNVPIKGIIWYQGESNADNIEDAMVYGDLFKRMILNYRKLWGLGNIPFIWVQLPNQADPANENNPGAYDAWPIVRTEQSKALTLPNTGEVCAIDLGEPDIHPKNKKPVGERIALIARNLVYGGNIPCYGPQYKSHTLLEDGKIILYFDNMADGLVAKNTVNDSIHWFSIADESGKLYRASALLKGDSVLVWNDAVKDPVMLRYAWEYNPQNTNLYNSIGLPAIPFKIQLTTPAPGIYKFSVSDTVIERGQNITLNWETHGNLFTTTLNNEPVDSIDAVGLWPLATTTYMLRMINKMDSTQSDSSVVTVKVEEPTPTITLKTDLGELVSPDSEVHLIADVFAPGWSVVQKVDFYINETILCTDTTAPYSATWKPAGNGDYLVKAVVNLKNGKSKESGVLKIRAALLSVSNYEVEKAILTGNGLMKNGNDASNAAYMEMQGGDWSLNFDNITVDKDGTYCFAIRYMCNYDPPKAQEIWVNNVKNSEILFTAPDNKTWMTYRINLPLHAGKNSIKIKSLWGWMSFDYLSLITESKD